ncbi:MAG: hypothetical protein A2677_00295 [Candidatus Komeilibacteria bacterium RIFCSPHIGHO2_01_FULL_52_14]|uniref:PilN domain-containing protein n=1 Tax=Candidatus Komeilibacteria bacterium RIFCSPHIGHO2_01_FULL_52_14 TaxID=1798549 RepID=A0A1G2BK14_9BACT|nr:MAG: hypothetical protein A2677_00295 [Candidatus Komeilibacteria bacterium RIFCSPHIGHO2_01_FULL_52_14]
MFGKKKNTDDELEDKGINLLPEEMRKSAEREQYVMRSPASPELRAPKKEKDELKLPGWIPMAGRMHWGAGTSTTASGSKKSVSGVSGPGGEGAGRGGAIPQKPDETRYHVYPRVEAGMQGRSAGTRPGQPFVQDIPIPSSESIDEARHYSLLQKKTGLAVPPPSPLQMPIAQGPAQPMKPVPPKAPETLRIAKKKRSGFMDWFAGLFGGKKTKTLTALPVTPTPQTPMRTRERPVASVAALMRERPFQAAPPKAPEPLRIAKKKRSGFMDWFAGLFGGKRTTTLRALPLTPIAPASMGMGERTAVSDAAAVRERPSMPLTPAIPFESLTIQQPVQRPKKVKRKWFSWRKKPAEAKPVPWVSNVRSRSIPMQGGAVHEKPLQPEPIRPVSQAAPARGRPKGAGFFARLFSKLFRRRGARTVIRSVSNRPLTRVSAPVPPPPTVPVPAVVTQKGFMPETVPIIRPVPMQEPSFPAPPAPPVRTAVPQTPVPIPSAVEMSTMKPLPKSIDSMRTTPVPIPVPPAKKEKTRRGTFHVPGKVDFTNLVSEARIVNLIPGQWALRKWPHIWAVMGGAVLAALGVITLVYGGLSLWQMQLEQRTAAIDQQIEKFRRDIQVYETQEPQMTSIGERINIIRDLLGQHIYWTNFFALLEKYTLPDVYYDGVAATTIGGLSLSSHASSYESITKLLKLLNSPDSQEFVTKATVSGAQQVVGEDNETQVAFTLELTLNPKLFYYHGASQEN